MKIVLKILLTLSLLFSIWSFSSYAAELNVNYVENTQTKNTDEGLNITSNSTGGPANLLDQELDTGNSQKGEKRNTKLETIWNSDQRFIEADAEGWDKWIFVMLVKVARALKNLFFAIASIYFLIIVLRLLFTENSEEEFGKFKKWIFWITIWIVIMQLAYSLVMTTFNKSIGWGLANDILQWIVIPLIKLLETAASFFFIAIAIFAFYRIVTSAWDEEKAKSWKMSIFYAIIGFIVIKISGLIVKTTYSKTLCDTKNNINCTATDIEQWASIIFKIINWLNGFVWIAVVIMIIYAWAQIIFSNGDEEKIKKAKTSLIYIVIGIFILIMNYLILTFFLLDKTQLG